MSGPPRRRTALAVRGVAMLSLVAAAACSGSTAASPRHPLGSVSVPVALPSPPSHDLTAAAREAILHPATKYFGLSVQGAPSSLQPLRAVAAAVGKTPNVVEYYKDWGDAFDPAQASNACSAGLLPVMTWESWSWADVANGAPAVSQPAYAPGRIAAGRYDSFIRSTAESVKSLGCPIVIRLDQEANGDWYPWGIRTPGMHNTAAQYVAMWRHVWTIFHQVGATNVLWAWSPNFVYPGGINNLRSLYPGNKYVDLVGIDGYVIGPSIKASSLYAATLRTLAMFAGAKPWLISEAGVAAGADQAAEISALLHSVATNPKLIGLIYFDHAAARANWSISATPEAAEAFRRGIAVPSYGHAPLLDP